MVSAATNVLPQLHSSWELHGNKWQIILWHLIGSWSKSLHWNLIGSWSKSLQFMVCIKLKGLRTVNIVENILHCPNGCQALLLYLAKSGLWVNYCPPTKCHSFQLSLMFLKQQSSYTKASSIWTNDSAVIDIVKRQFWCYCQKSFIFRKAVSCFES